MRPLVLLGGLGREEARRRAGELLQAVSLPASYFDRLPGEISGGEKQRVAIARAFAAEPELILCDEPISSLDVSVQGSLMNLLMKLQLEQRTSYVFISHDLSAVQHLSDTIAVVYLGRVMEIGDAVRVLTPPYHPYTEALLSAVPVADPDVKQTPIRLGGTVPSAMDVPPGCRFHPRCPRLLGEVCRAAGAARGGRARATTASTVTSRSTSSAACRSRRWCSCLTTSRRRTREAPNGAVHRPPARLRGADGPPVVDDHLRRHRGAARRRRQHDARPLRHSGGQGRPPPGAGPRRAAGGPVHHMAQGLRER